ncbi:MAG: DUF1203 domain-containing protein [Parasphingorhabdus sp.]|uniref:DUF1203 domain-containing protein n=1 Tax=Parasphingorhabdus sp. TaxID=2709688 RepID=UPI003298FAE0
MTYQITGISPETLASHKKTNESRTVSVKATSKPGFPCRVSLEDAEEGEELLLFHHVSHDVESPYRSSYAIYARSSATKAARYTDEVPPVFQGRPLGMRAFGTDAMLKTAGLSMPGDADKTIRELFELDEVAYIDVHNAAHGCFVARVERFDQ